MAVAGSCHASSTASRGSGLGAAGGAETSGRGAPLCGASSMAATAAALDVASALPGSGSAFGNSIRARPALAGESGCPSSTPALGGGSDGNGGTLVIRGGSDGVAEPPNAIRCPKDSAWSAAFAGMEGAAASAADVAMTGGGTVDCREGYPAVGGGSDERAAATGGADRGRGAGSVSRTISPGAPGSVGARSVGTLLVREGAVSGGFARSAAGAAAFGGQIGNAPSLIHGRLRRAFSRRSACERPCPFAVKGSVDASSS